MEIRGSVTANLESSLNGRPGLLADLPEHNPEDHSSDQRHWFTRRYSVNDLIVRPLFQLHNGVIGVRGRDSIRKRLVSDPDDNFFRNRIGPGTSIEESVQLDTSYDHCRLILITAKVVVLNNPEVARKLIQGLDPTPFFWLLDL